MTFVRRFVSWVLGVNDESDEGPNEDSREPVQRAPHSFGDAHRWTPTTDANRAEDEAEALLRRAAEGTGDADEAALLGALAVLTECGREARAIGLGRSVLASRPELAGLRFRIAELASFRGEDETALLVLGPLLELGAPPPEVRMLEGELKERLGDEEGALAAYERVVSVALDFPSARERVVRLRTRRDTTAGASATLMTHGALARGRYRVERELGRGGAGTVFAAMDASLDRPVALKVYHRRGRYDRERLRAEARTPAGLEHPGVIRIFDLDELLGSISMEIVDGGSVRAVIRRGGVTFPRAATWARSILDALDYVHRAGVVHRDIKPSNLLLREDDLVVLTDFGIAARSGDGPRSDAMAEGTLLYMPPEQRSGAPTRPEADIYAFGATMREIVSHLTGQEAAQFHTAIDACLSPRPEERPTIEELLQVLPEG